MFPNRSITVPMTIILINWTLMAMESGTPVIVMQIMEMFGSAHLTQSKWSYLAKMGKR